MTLIYSPSYESHVEHVKQVLTKLRGNQLYVKGKKCEFHDQSTKFLGYVIEPEGAAMDQGKVRAVSTCPGPASVKDFQRFIGFANFYHWFITVSAPLQLPSQSC